MYQEKIVFALVGVLVGFLANKIYEIIASKLKLKKIHSSLIQELMAILENLENLKLLYENKINGNDSFHRGAFPRKIIAPIYDKYYADICLHLNRSQRSSFQQIHIIIEEINDFISIYFKDKCDDEKCAVNCKSRIATNYATVDDLIFLVQNHIDYKRQPIIKPQIEAELIERRKLIDDYLKERGCNP